MASASYLIWSAITPLLQTYLTIIAGFTLAKLGYWNRASSKTVSTICLRLALPCLVFSNIVPSFNSDNISALGPLFSLGFLYIAIGGVFGWLIRECLYVPLDFRQGVFVLCLVSNFGNIPTAIVQAITQHDPFDPDRDPELGISYAIIFVIVYNIVFWILPTARSLANDYQPGVPHGEDAEKKLPLEERTTFKFVVEHLPSGMKKKLAASAPPTRPSSPPMDAFEMSSLEAQQTTVNRIRSTRSTRTGAGDELSKTPQEPYRDEPDAGPGAKATRPPTEPPQAVPPSEAVGVENVEEAAAPDRPMPVGRRVLKAIRGFIAPFISPIIISMICAIIIALVPPLKALFTHRDATTYRFGSPNGEPPLGWLLDTASFIGNMHIPLAVVQLGGAFAEIRFPRPLSRLPWAAMILVSVAKMAIMPVIGVAIVQVFTRDGFMDRDNVALRFVGMFLSGTPSAVNQLTVTQLYCGDHSLSTLSSFLLVQYIFMLFSSAILIAIALKFL